MKVFALIILISVAAISPAQVLKLPVKPVAPHAIVPPNSVPAGKARPDLWGTGQALAAPGIGLPTKTSLNKWVNVDEMIRVYGLDQVGGQGAGITIAIVDAYDSPTAEADLNDFSSAYGLPLCTAGTGCFTKVNQTGDGSLANLPSYDSGWSQEINLDIEWVHAIAPQAKILLVEAYSNSNTNLFAAVAYAATKAPVVSMSWSGGEYANQSADWDGMLSHPYVTYLASTGDSGGWIGYPSTSSKVIAVGGTTLAFDNTKPTFPVLFPVSESGWSGSGGGCSAYTPSLSFQRPLVPKICTKRAVPDLSLDADPNSGVLVRYQSHWYIFGGTSLACPVAAAAVGIANGLRLTAGKLPLDSTLQYLYSNSPYPTYYRDITTGTAGLWPFLWSASAGFDFVTGVGAPKADALVPYLVSLP